MRPLFHLAVGSELARAVSRYEGRLGASKLAAYGARIAKRRYGFGTLATTSSASAATAWLSPRASCA